MFWRILWLLQNKDIVPLGFSQQFEAQLTLLAKTFISRVAGALQLFFGSNRRVVPRRRRGKARRLVYSMSIFLATPSNANPRLSRLQDIAEDSAKRFRELLVR